MKKIIFLGLVVLLGGCGNTSQSKETINNNIKACEDLSKISGLIMKMRQSGMPANEILKSFEGGKGYTMDLIEHFVKEAYAVPKYTNQTQIDTQVNDFQSKQFLECREMTK
ncbi:hypothetical protein ACX2RO_000016 [Acinetobacter baumannii]|nr:hypothetical protein [Acinetobacter baumannii]